MKTLVTGAPGWLGTRLVEVLSKTSDVRCLVQNGVSTTHLDKLGIEIVRGDVTDSASLKTAVKNVDTVFHCAGIIHPKAPSDFYLVNTNGTKNIIDASHNAGVKKFIYVSSNSAQGVNIRKERLMAESDPCRPYTDYGKSKYRAEQIVKDFQNSGKIETVIIRPCWFYGPRQPARMTKLIKMIKNGNALVFGDGKNLRSMTYVDNLVDALLLVKSKKSANGKIYWVADEKPHTTLEIYNEIAKNLGVKLETRQLPGMVSQVLESVDILLGKAGIYNINIHVGGEMRRNIACDTSKIRRDLGYKPKISFKKGIKNMVEWSVENNLV